MTQLYSFSGFFLNMANSNHFSVRAGKNLRVFTRDELHECIFSVIRAQSYVNGQFGSTLVPVYQHSTADDNDSFGMKNCVLFYSNISLMSVITPFLLSLYYI